MTAFAEISDVYDEKDEEVNLTGASADLRSIKKAVITLGSDYKSGTESPANIAGALSLAPLFCCLPDNRVKNALTLEFCSSLLC